MVHLKNTISNSFNSILDLKDSIYRRGVGHRQQKELGPPRAGKELAFQIKKKTIAPVAFLVFQSPLFPFQLS